MQHPQVQERLGRIVAEHAEDVVAGLRAAARALSDPGPFVLLDLRDTARRAGAAVHLLVALAQDPGGADRAARQHLAEATRRLKTAAAACRQASDLPVSEAVAALERAAAALAPLAA